MKIILASGSPRRLQLLQQMGWGVEVHSLPFAESEAVNEAEEKLDSLRKRFLLSGEKTNIENESVLSEKDMALLTPYRNADLVCAYNALGKGRAAAKVTGTGVPVVAADTIVVLGEQILGKPADTAEAKCMLKNLSGKAHAVKTAAVVLYQKKTLLQVVTTNVHFRRLTEEEIDWYVGTGEPLDKAGSYGIQGKGAVLVERIEGSYDNVVGLPLIAVYEMLRRAGVEYIV
ncbi:MAG: septum formation protein Maf [Acidaminococcaceae bacterium]|nr:septum formation protein Maf [Acidaminococcaceae bacterium]